MRMNDPGRIVDIDQVTPIRAIFTLFLEDKILNNRKFIQKFCLLVQVCSFYGFLKHLHLHAQDTVQTLSFTIVLN